MMRNCYRCQSDMVEGFDIKVENEGCGVKISSSTKFFAKRIERPKVAICPECGEISLYIENLDEVKKKKAND